MFLKLFIITPITSEAENKIQRVDFLVIIHNSKIVTATHFYNKYQKQIMADIQALKFRIVSLQSQLADKEKALEQYQTIESQADNKIKALTKMHADKIKNLLNSIQILKKQKASLEGSTKEHQRSKLITQLNKEIADQDLAIEVLRKWVYDQQGKEKGREICDQIIVNALKKGPERVRPLSREQLRMEIDRLKSINLNLQSKLKNGDGKKVSKKQQDDEQLSEVSSVTEQSFVNTNDEIFKKLKQIQFQNENMKLQVNAKLKIIEKLKTDLKEADKLRTELDIVRNEAEVANKKVSTYERLMKESKENTNAKIIQLYQREIKVEELEMMSKENRDKLKQAQQTHSILLEELKAEKDQLQAEFDEMKGENEQLIIENISSKKRLDQLKKIVKDMDELQSKLKEDMVTKIKNFEQQIERIVLDNKKYNDAYKNIENTLFEERAQWVDEKSRLLEELNSVQQNKANTELINKYLEDIAQLKMENEELKQILEGGGQGTGDDKVLLARLAALEQKNKFLESKGKLSENDRFTQLYEEYNQMLKKYDDLLQEFEAFKQKYGPKNKEKTRKQVITLTQKQKSEYEIMSSGLSRLDLEQIDSDILDNFDSSLEYQFVINERGERVKMPKLTEADRELLKLMTSDLWGFVNDERMDQNIRKAAEFVSEDEEDGDVRVDFREVRKLRNLSNPKGKKVVMYEEQLGKLNEISDGVSITSAIDPQLNKFDSDVNIQIKKLPKGGALRPLNTYKLEDVSLSVDGDQSSLSSAKLGDSNIVKKKKKVDEKGSRIDMKKLRESQKSSDFEKSSIGSELLDSDVSSAGIRESKLAMMDSDIDADFKKKKK